MNRRTVSPVYYIEDKTQRINLNAGVIVATICPCGIEHELWLSDLFEIIRGGGDIDRTMVLCPYCYQKKVDAEKEEDEVSTNG